MFNGWGLHQGRLVHRFQIVMWIDYHRRMIESKPPLRIWVTRDQRSIAASLSALRNAGAICMAQPLLKLRTIAASDKHFLSAMAKSGDAKMWIVSSSKAAQALKHRNAQLFAHHQPHFVAVGPATAHALRMLGAKLVTFPQISEGTEAVLQLDCLQNVAGKQIAIANAPDGRDQICNSLRERGAIVHAVPVYRRTALKPGVAFDNWINQGLAPPFVWIASTAAIRALAQYLEHFQWPMADWPLLVVSHRLALNARQLGFQHVDMLDSANLDLLQEWVAAHSRIR
jgi:uroporphyrinogen-III synthase